MIKKSVQEGGSEKKKPFPSGSSRPEAYLPLPMPSSPDPRALYSALPTRVQVTAQGPPFLVSGRWMPA